MPHTGGQRIKEGDEYYKTHRPLARGRRPARPADGRRRRSRVELYPKNAVLDGKGATQQMVVRAKYSDGTDRDVTSLALFLSNNDNSAKIAPDGAGDGRRARRGVRHGPLRHLHRRRRR